MINPELSWRYERKFLVENISPGGLTLRVLKNPAAFVELYKPRTINSLYFDTLDFSFYRANVQGDNNRLKYRIRWYGKLFGHTSLQLEIKKKTGLLGTKHVYNLGSHDIKPENTARDLKTLILETESIPEDIRAIVSMIQPVVLTRYDRRYYRCRDTKLRVTLDRNLEFYSVFHNTFSKIYGGIGGYLGILELKYAAELDDYARDISCEFLLRSTKSSKYVSAVDCLQNL